MTVFHSLFYERSTVKVVCSVLRGAILGDEGAYPVQEGGLLMHCLASDYTVVELSPAPKEAYCFSPAILKLPNGSLLATMDYGGRDLQTVFPKSPVFARPHFCMPINETNLGRAYLSRDGGKSWHLTAEFPLCHQRPLWAGNSVYIIGHHGDIGILRSDDYGESWSPVSDLTCDSYWHQSACNVWQDGGHVYLVMEKMPFLDKPRWASGLAPVLMRADAHADLTDSAAWTFADTLPFCTAVPLEGLDYIGVPQMDGPTHTPPGWLESNVVRFTDPAHRLFDPSGRTLHLFLRAHTDLTNYACLLQVRENEDGTMTTGFVRSPAGKKMLYVPMPGGQMKFFILNDPQTGLFWLLSSQSTNGMMCEDQLPVGQYPWGQERYRLALHFSKNCFDWCFAGMVAIGDTSYCSRSYAAMDIDGEDLIITSRSGSPDAQSPHDTNMITFHRVAHFRDLVY